MWAEVQSDSFKDNHCQSFRFLIDGSIGGLVAGIAALAAVHIGPPKPLILTLGCVMASFSAVYISSPEWSILNRGAGVVRVSDDQISLSLPLSVTGHLRQIVDIMAPRC